MGVLRKLWQVISFIFVLYGFYLLFLFLWDTLNRVSEDNAVLIAGLITVTAMSGSGFLWLRKHREHLPIKI